MKSLRMGGEPEREDRVKQASTKMLENCPELDFLS